MKQVVYISSPESQQIHAWHLQKGGDLKLLQVINVIGQVQPMVVSPRKNFLYVGVRPNFRVLAYRIAADGCLSLSGEAPLPGSPTHISTDRQGKYLFCGSYNDACVSISPIDNDGLPQAPSQVINDLVGCHSVNIDLRNQRLFVPVLKQDRICLFWLHANGILAPCEQVQVNTVEGAGPRHMTFHPNGNYAYCVNELDSTVNVWALKSVYSQVKCVQSLDMMPKYFKDKRWAADIHITPNGCFLYACERTSSTITIFSISKDGAVLVIEGFQKTEMQPRGFNVDNSGQYLVVAGQKSDHIQVYKIQEHGLLMPLARYAIGKGPMYVVIHHLN